MASLLVAGTATAQKKKPVVTAPKPIIFAVLNDGLTLEPVAYINKGKLTEPVNGSDDPNIIKAFTKTYYKPGTAYRLVFGGANAGSVSVKSSDPNSECGKNTASAIVKGNKTPLKGFVMALATSAEIKLTTNTRRKPTVAEKAEIDALAKAQFIKEKVTPKVLRYQNLTAIDVDNDGTPEFVGSYWVEIDKLTRAILFLIADKGSSGKYSIGYSEYRLGDQSSIMSGKIKDIDDGIYHELLLDAFDYDSDGTAEIFTYVQSFEGAAFNSYQRTGEKWTKNYEWSNYHCAY